MRQQIEKALNFKAYQARCRRRRGDLFKHYLRPTENDRILDLGGEDGRYIGQVLPFRANVTIADIDAAKLRRAAAKGYRTILLDETGLVPAEDGFFDVIFCSSVIEHVTISKKKLEAVTSSRVFKELARLRQEAFAREIHRVGKGYFVQTPYKYFPLESHSRLPMPLVLLPRRPQIAILKFFRKFWIARTSPDWNLLTVKDLRQFFPEAMILRERAFGLTKSIMAVKPRDRA